MHLIKQCLNFLTESNIFVFIRNIGLLNEKLLKNTRNEEAYVITSAFSDTQLQKPAEVGSRYKKVLSVPVLGTFQKVPGLLCRYPVLCAFKLVSQPLMGTNYIQFAMVSGYTLVCYRPMVSGVLKTFKTLLLQITIVTVLSEST